MVREPIIYIMYILCSLDLYTSNSILSIFYIYVMGLLGAGNCDMPSHKYFLTFTQCYLTLLSRICSS